MKREWFLAAALLAAIAPAAAADAKPAAAKTAAAPLTAGEVTKIDREARKITVKHGPIENLKLPSMTMVFRVKDAAMLDGVEAGTHIRFHAEEANGGYVVTRLLKTKAK